MAVLIKGMEMPKACDSCRFLDDNGDYPFCLISQDQRGYTFNTRNERMPTCPLKEQDEAVPLKPLAEWLARYCTPPQNTPIHDIFRKSREEIYGYLTVEWEQFLRGMNWEGLETLLNEVWKEVDDG